MKNLVTSTTAFPAINTGSGAPTVILMRKRPTEKVVATSQAIDPTWVKKIDDYAEIRKERVKQRFIDSPFLLSSFYEFLGMIPKEVRDIEKHVQAGEARMAMDEIDDLADKIIEWRMKLSHKLSTDL